MRHAVVSLVAFTSLAAGCVPPRSLSPTLDAQRDAMTAIRASYDTDLALLAAHLESSLEMQRTILLGRIDREMVQHGYLEADTGPEQLRHDLSDAEAGNVIVDDLRAGRLTIADADRLLADYRAAESLTDPLAAQVRAKLVDRLHVLQEFDRTSIALRGAMADHATDIAWLFDEADRSTTTLYAYARQQPEVPQVVIANAPELWSRFVLTRITDPARRAAAEQLLADLLSLATVSAPTD